MKIGIVGSEYTSIQQLLNILDEYTDSEVTIYSDNKNNANKFTDEVHAINEHAKNSNLHMHSNLHIHGNLDEKKSEIKNRHAYKPGDAIKKGEKKEFGYIYKGNEVMPFPLDEEIIEIYNCDALIILQLSEKSRLVEDLLKRDKKIVDCTRYSYIEHPLYIVPQINGSDIDATVKYAKNPARTAIALSLTLKTLHAEFGVKTVRALSLESLLATGEGALDDYLEQIQSAANNKPLIADYLNFPILGNIIPYTGQTENHNRTNRNQHELYTAETESCNQTKSILHDMKLFVDIISVSVPVPRCSSMAVFCELMQDAEIGEFEHALKQNKELVLLNDTKNNKFPMPYYLEETDKIYVGRIKQNGDFKNNFSFWLVSDAMRKSYLTNAVQTMLLMVAGK